MPDAQRAEIAKLEALHAGNPQGRIFTHLAEAYRKAGELERARTVLSEGIERHPEYSSAHVVLARVLADMGDEEAAAAEFRRVLELDSHNLVALRSLGDLARHHRRTDEARDYYERLLDVEPSDQDVRELLESLDRPAAPAERDAAAAADEPGGGAEAPAFQIERAGDEFGGPDADEDVPWIHGDEGEAAREEGLAMHGEPFAADLEEPEEPEEPLAAGGAGERSVAPAEDPFGAAPGDALADVPEDAGDEERGVGAGAGEDVGASGADSWDALSPEAEDEEDAEDAPLPELPYLDDEEEDDAGLMTETIAQVYARQGLYDRAAEVYRQLVRSRPSDTALRARLAEMDALASQPRPDSPGAEREALLMDDEEERPDVVPPPGLTGRRMSPPDVAPLAGLESNDLDPDTGLRFEGGPGAKAQRDADAWTPPEVESAEAEEPGQDPWSPAGAEDVEDVEEPWAAAEPAASEPWESAPEGQPEPWSEEDVAEEEEPWAAAAASEESPWASGPPAAEAPPSEAGAGEQPRPEGGPDEDARAASATEPGDAEAGGAREGDEDAELVESVWTGADGAAAGEASPYAWAEEAEPPADDDSEPIAAYLRSLLQWPPPGGAPAPDAKPAADAEPSGEGDGDDDLDTFRSWLESLKQ